MPPGALGGSVGARKDVAGAEVAGGREGLVSGSVWDRENDEDVGDDLRDEAEREGPR